MKSNETAPSFDPGKDILSIAELGELLENPFMYEEIHEENAVPFLAYEITAGAATKDPTREKGEIPEKLRFFPGVICGVSSSDLLKKAYEPKLGLLPFLNASDIILTDKDMQKDNPHVASADPCGDLKMLYDAVARNPVASTSFVQLLRMGETLSVPDRIIAESFTYSTLQSGTEFRNWLRANSSSDDKKDAGKSDDKKGAGKSEDKNSQPPVIAERKDDELHLTLNRPEKHNAYNKEMRDGLMKYLRVASADSDLEKIHLKAAGPSFCSGGDLNEFGTTPDPASAHVIRSTRSVALWLEHLRNKVYAHLHGACVGAGVELPSFAHHVAAAEDTFFMLPEVGMGLVPGAGGTASIPARIGRQRAAWMGTSQQRINAQTALEWGLVDEIT